MINFTQPTLGQEDRICSQSCGNILPFTPLENKPIFIIQNLENLTREELEQALTDLAEFIEDEKLRNQIKENMKGGKYASSIDLFYSKIIHLPRIYKK